MPETGCILLSVLSLVLGAMFILFPERLGKLSAALNRTMAAVDERILRYRHLIGLVLFGLGYGLFKVSLMLSSLRD